MSRRDQSLYLRVAKVIEQAGRVRTDHLQTMFPEVSAAKVAGAAKNAAFMGLIHCTERIAIGKARIGVWAAGPAPKDDEEGDDIERPEPPLPPRGQYGIPRVASVWELGSNRA
jgi:hypothetical protein